VRKEGGGTRSSVRRRGCLFSGGDETIHKKQTVHADDEEIYGGANWGGKTTGRDENVENR